MSRALPTACRALRTQSPLLPKPRPAHRQVPRSFTTKAPLRDRLPSLNELAGSSRGGSGGKGEAEVPIEILRRNRNRAAIGMALSIAATIALISFADFGDSKTADKSDAGAVSFPSTPGSPEDEKTRNLRATGTSSVPFFPRTITLPSGEQKSTATPALPAGVALPGTPTASNNDEFTLLGLGIRTVSFLSIQVYVVGLYVATADLPVLQAAMIKAGADVETASTLVSTEKKQLKERILDPEEGSKIWDKLLQENNVRSVVRVVPTRGTDYAHLRDGWVRGIMARSGNATKSASGEAFDDEAFGKAVGEFKQMFGARKIGKGKVLLLEREKSGRLTGWEQTGSDEHFGKMGSVEDERVGRLVWMGYLAGKNVSSEGARADVVEGVLELVERPVGTVETQVI